MFRQCDICKVVTSAADSDTNTHISYADNKVTVIDTVKYENVIAGEEFTVTGKLIDKSTGKVFLSNGKEVTGTTTFTAEDTNGTAEVVFEFDASDLAGKDLVVFETLEWDSFVIGVHNDLDDLDQTIEFPEMGTKAFILSSGKNTVEAEKEIVIVDNVKYANIRVEDLEGREVTLEGILMDKATGKPFLVDGKEITAKQNFVIDKESGELKLEFPKIDSKLIEGKSIVVFEKLYFNDTPIASHEDINDMNQTISSPIGTIIVDDNDKLLSGSDAIKTGDNMRFIIPALVLLILGSAAGAVLTFNRRREEK